MSLPPAESDPPTAGDSQSWTDLSVYTVGDYQPGAGLIVRLAWHYTSLVLFESGWFPIMGFKARVLRWFGARIGRGLVIKPNVRIKYPWRLEVGDHVWIGQDAWIDNIVDVRIGSHVCVSQGVYLCTGSHDHRTRKFELTPGEITVGDGAWLAAKSTILAGVTIGPNAVAAAGSVVSKDVPVAAFVGGVPAKELGTRQPPTG